MWTGIIWLRKMSSDSLLQTRKWSFGFHKIWKFIDWMADYTSELLKMETKDIMQQKGVQKDNAVTFPVVGTFHF
jgi:hypothetical protein